MLLVVALSLARPAHITRRSPALPLRQTLPLFCQHQVALLGLLLVIGLAGCGPASSDNPPNQESRASESGTALSKQSPPLRNYSPVPATQASNPIPLASGIATIAASRKETHQGEGSTVPEPAPSTQQADTLPPLVVPAWIAKDLASPDVGTRIRAMETWVQSAPPGSIDPLILAYEDKDERVRTRAMELIEQDWARAADSLQ